jgi:hypothetical protein
MERVELTSRLSAFDSFLFLVETEQEGGNGHDNQAVAARVDLPKDDGAASSDNTNKVNSGAEALEKNLSEEEKTEARIEFIDLSQEESTTKIESYPTLPIHESNARSVPGSREERREMAEKLKGFDKYMFLLEDHERNKSAASGVAAPAAIAVVKKAAKTGTGSKAKKTAPVKRKPYPEKWL